MPFEDGDCDTAEYSLGSDGYVTVLNSEDRKDGEQSSKGWAYCDSNGTGQCYVKFSIFSPYASYRVLETDYNTYTCVFSCFSVGLFHFEWGWYLARSTDY
jgi:apolipoprotein D and lipocalin family protein|mmetsp:Transcript_12055/g.1811  ORF Transcript_12055/g.1811 Transcript_12055/m.1811 type:complete len:100 (-) Transcript_12055:119-418(-)